MVGPRAFSVRATLFMMFPYPLGTVGIYSRICSYYQWQINGFTCAFVCATIQKGGKDLNLFVDHYFHTQTIFTERERERIVPHHLRLRGSRRGWLLPSLEIYEEFKRGFGIRRQSGYGVSNPHISTQGNATECTIHLMV